MKSLNSPQSYAEEHHQLAHIFALPQESAPVNEPLLQVFSIDQKCFAVHLIFPDLNCTALVQKKPGPADKALLQGIGNLDAASVILQKPRLPLSISADHDLPCRVKTSDHHPAHLPDQPVALP